MYDRLEPRTLLAALTITGGVDVKENILLTQSGTTIKITNKGTTNVVANSTALNPNPRNINPNTSLDVPNVTSLLINLGGGADIVDATLVNLGMTIIAGPDASAVDDADSIIGGKGIDSILGGAGGDVLKGGPGNDILRGGSGTDNFTGGTGRDSMFGDNDDDFFTNQDGTIDSINGGNGNDRSNPNTDNDFVVSVENQNVFSETTRRNGNYAQLNGTDGNDVILVGATGDTINYTINGVQYDISLASLQAESNANPDPALGPDLKGILLLSGKGNDSITITSDVFPLPLIVFSNEGNDSVLAAGAADSIYGGAGNDSLVGAGGDDLLCGGSGNDSLLGGDGSNFLAGDQTGDPFNQQTGDPLDKGPDGRDFAIYAQHATQVIVDLELGTADGAGFSDDLDAVEGAVGGSDADILTGNNAFHCTLIGGAGDDSLVGHDGNDSLVPNAGNDSLTGGEGTDTASLADYTAPVNLTLNDTGDDGAAGETKNILGDVEIVVGGSGADSITGNNARQTLIGGEGDDSLIGLAGDDCLLGQLGNDSILGGADNDVLGGGDGDNVLTDNEGENIFLLSGFTPVSAINGWGPAERDRSNGETGAADGKIITLNGQQYDSGIGVHADSQLDYNLGGLYTRFLTDIGVDDETGKGGNVIFQVFADGFLLYDSGKMTGSSSTRKLDLDVSGRTTLTLKVLSNGATTSDHADWANARLSDDATPAPTDSYLSDWTPSFAANGWGNFERDRSNGELGSFDGNQIKLNGIVYHKGLGVHADSNLIFDVLQQYSLFTADIGVDDEVGNNGNVIFQVLGDGVPIFESDAMTGASPTQHLSLDISGVDQLQLLVLANGAKAYDHADWANARVWVNTPPPPPPGGIFISDLPTVSETNGWGRAERDRSNGENASGDGNILSIGGVTYAKGMGVHAGSTLIYDIEDMGFTQFLSDIGIDDEVGSRGSVNFQVFGDDVQLFSTAATVLGGYQPVSISANVTGVKILKLVVTGGLDGINYDHADWADARLV